MVVLKTTSSRIIILISLLTILFVTILSATILLPTILHVIILFSHHSSQNNSCLEFTESLGEHRKRIGQLWSQDYSAISSLHQYLQTFSCCGAPPRRFPLPWGTWCRVLNLYELQRKLQLINKTMLWTEKMNKKIAHFDKGLRYCYPVSTFNMASAESASLSILIAILSSSRFSSTTLVVGFRARDLWR